MAIKVTDMGLQPVATVADDFSGATGDMVPTTQWDFTGKDVGEAFGMLDKTAEMHEEQDARRRDNIGIEKFTTPDGRVFEDFAAREEFFSKQPGYLETRVRPGITVPALPWQQDRLPGERYADYISRTRGAARKEVA